MTQSQMNLGLHRGISYQGSTGTSGVELPGVVKLVVEEERREDENQQQFVLSLYILSALYR